MVLGRLTHPRWREADFWLWVSAVGSKLQPTDSESQVPNSSKMQALIPNELQSEAVVLV
jgi:hypothetical protein